MWLRKWDDGVFFTRGEAGVAAVCVSFLRHTSFYIRSLLRQSNGFRVVGVAAWRRFVQFSYLTSVSVATAPFRLKPQWNIHAHASSCLFRLSYINFDWIFLSLCFSLFWWFRAEERHLSESCCRATTLCWNWAAAAQRHPRHHQVVERRGWASGRRCPVLARHTLSLFLWTCFDILSQPRGYYDAFTTAGAGCSAGGVAAPPGRHWDGCCCASIIAGPGVNMQADLTQGSCICASLFSVNTSAAFGQPRCVPFLVEGQCGELARHEPRSLFFVRFCWRLLLLLTSLLCCPCSVVSRWTMDLQ